MTDSDIDQIMKPLTLLELANSVNPNQNDTSSLPRSEKSAADDLPYHMVNGVKVRLRKKPSSTSNQLRMSVTKDDETKRFSLTFEPVDSEVSKTLIALLMHLFSCS